MNAAVLVGYRVAGLPGALTAVLGNHTAPPMIVLSVISLFYTAFRESLVVAAVLKGMRAGVVAVIADVVYTMGRGVFKEKRISSVLVMAAAFLAAWAFGVNVIFCHSGLRPFRALRAIADAKRGSCSDSGVS